MKLIKRHFVVESWNRITIKVDIYFAGIITQLIGVPLAKALHKFKDIKSPKN